MKILELNSACSHIISLGTRLQIMLYYSANTCIYNYSQKSHSKFGETTIKHNLVSHKIETIAPSTSHKDRLRHWGRDKESEREWDRDRAPAVWWHQMLHHVALQRFETLPSNCNNFSPVASAAASASVSACTWLLLHQHKKHKFWPVNRDAPNNYSNSALQHASSSRTASLSLVSNSQSVSSLRKHLLRFWFMPENWLQLQ